MDKEYIGTFSTWLNTILELNSPKNMDQLISAFQFLLCDLKNMEKHGIVVKFHPKENYAYFSTQDENMAQLYGFAPAGAWEFEEKLKKKMKIEEIAHA